MHDTIYFFQEQVFAKDKGSDFKDRFEKTRVVKMKKEEADLTADILIVLFHFYYKRKNK